MNYEKKYKEALERAKDYHKQLIDEDNSEWAGEIENIFPELADSEDEKVRKVLVGFFKSYKEQGTCGAETFNGIPTDNILAWLEKQGGQKTFDYKNATIQQKDFAPKAEPKFKVCDTMRTLQEANDGYTDGMPVVVSIDNEYYHCTNELIAIKDQDDYEFPPINVKQKHNDNPKFKVGDWVVISTSDGEKVVWIDTIEYFKSGEPRYITSEGRWFGNGTKAHLWSIQDAKPGDVLVSGQMMFVFNKLHGVWINCSCSFHKDGSFCEEDYDLMHIKYSKEVYPATKEQHDLLFEKMREAGYEWDEDKKELSKIEKQGEKEEVDGFDAELNALLKKYEHLPKEELQEPLEFYLGVVRDDLDIVREEKPKWTEEDECYMGECVSAVATKDGWSFEEKRKTKHWLKSLKQRMEEQQ